MDQLNIGEEYLWNLNINMTRLCKNCYYFNQFILWLIIYKQHIKTHITIGQTEGRAQQIIGKGAIYGI